MTLGAVLMVKDEIDLLRKNIAYHSSIGVDCFVICDRGSSENARLELQALAESDNIHLLHQDIYRLPEVNPAIMREVRLAGFEEMRRVFAPDWTFPADTDEFWVPRSGDLTSIPRATEAEHLCVKRFNAAMTLGAVPNLMCNIQDHNALHEKDIVVEREVLSSARMESEPEIPWVFHAVGSKFMTSRRDFVEVAPGFHDVRYSDEVPRRAALDLLIYHLPFTTFERFTLKVASVRQHLEHIGSTFKAGQAWHWRRWVSVADVGVLEREFDKQFFSPDSLADLRRRGGVMSIKEYFAALAGDRARFHERFAG